ncbi:MAG: RluA family pseudouridine synthase [Bacteroidales bacterium]|nr:RluA family pseudouridine synthase [Bacteroidales bacterium]
MNPIANQIIYEDNHLIALNKLPGQIVQGDKTGDTPLVELVKSFIKERDAKPGNVFCGVIHRLDRPVSGVVIFAKTSKALTRMNELVQSRDFHKTYLAVVKQQPPSPQGHLEDYLLRNEKLNKSFVTRDTSQPGAKLAKLDYRLLAASRGGYHLLEVELHTGRHHQIRCQLAHMGCPIKGDLKYGAARSNPDASISLHAYRLAFEHPVRHEQVTILAPHPFEMFAGIPDSNE